MTTKLLTGFCLAVAALSARAADPCKADVEQLCQGVQPGGGRIVQCLKDHADKLSPPCREKFVAEKEAGQKVHQACKADLRALCTGIEPGGGRLIQCLEEHKDKLSPDCSAAMAAAHKEGAPGGKPRAGEIPAACQPEVDGVCKDSAYGGKPMVLDCLRSYEDKLSPACKQALGIKTQAQP